MDLSWLRGGNSVNNGIHEHLFMGHSMNLHYPMVDDLCRRAATLGTGCKGWKHDLNRAFKQLFSDPADWPLLGIVWENALFFDKTTVMGSRSAPYCCQHTTNFIRHIMKNLEYFVANYVDNFMGLELPHWAWMAFNTLGNLLHDLNISESLDKAVPPTDEVEFLGVLFNLRTLTMSVTPEKLQQFKVELHNWRIKMGFTCKQLESLLGKMQFMANCVRPARVFVYRLRAKLISTQKTGSVDEDMEQDLQWWRTFLEKYNGVSIMWMCQKLKVDCVMASDLCLTGMGAYHNNEYIHSRFPQEYQDQNKYKIHHLEMLAILVSMRIWRNSLSGYRFAMRCDNQLVVEVVNSGYTRDKILQEMMRELVMIASISQFEVALRYITSRDNQILDVLSRIHLGGKYCKLFKKVIPGHWKRRNIRDEFFNTGFTW